MRLWTRLKAAAEAERPRWPLWLPVGLGTGCALYFAAPIEPSLGFCGGVAALAMIAGIAAPRWPALALAAALGLGFVAAKLREEWVAAPVLDRPVIAHLSGRVEAVDTRDRGVRLIVGDLRSGAFGAVPAQVRISLARDPELGAGQWISLTAELTPPPGPSEPGASDFGRAAFFDGLGAVGFAYGAARPAPLAHSPDGGARLDEAIENLRWGVTRRIRARLPGSEGAIASALITGQRGGIDPDDEAALRDAGLAHVLAIAGLHMALVGMGLFWLVRAVLAAIPALALNYPIKKWSAAAALAGAAFYLVISGGAASATRAFVMLAMMLLAILIDRPALSMRSLGLAATILLLLRPESITEPGFQMSFAAVTALVAVAEWEQKRERTAPRGPVWRYWHGIAATSLVGSLATMPFAIFHFDRKHPLCGAGQSAGASVPVMGFVVMPWPRRSVLPPCRSVWKRFPCGFLGLGHRSDGVRGPLGFQPAWRCGAGACFSGMDLGADGAGRIMDCHLAARVALVGIGALDAGHRPGMGGAAAGPAGGARRPDHCRAGARRPAGLCPPAQGPFRGAQLAGARWRCPRAGGGSGGWPL